MEGLAGFALEGAVFWNVPCGLVPLHFFLALFICFIYLLIFLGS